MELMLGILKLRTVLINLPLHKMICLFVRVEKILFNTINESSATRIINSPVKFCITIMLSVPYIVWGEGGGRGLGCQRGCHSIYNDIQRACAWSILNTLKGIKYTHT